MGLQYLYEAKLPLYLQNMRRLNQITVVKFCLITQYYVTFIFELKKTNFTFYRGNDYTMFLL